MTNVTIDGISMTTAAAECVAETGISVADDVTRVRDGLTADALLAECLDGADADREQGWRDYVDALTVGGRGGRQTRQEDETMTYTYTIFDADPQSSSGTAWDTHTDVELEADSAEEAISDVRDALEVEAAGLSQDDGYEVGQRLYALVWYADGTVVEQVSYELTADDLA